MKILKAQQIKADLTVRTWRMSDVLSAVMHVIHVDNHDEG
jgi:hypothetical protein